MSGTLTIGNKEIFSHSDATDKVTYGSGVPAGTVIQVQSKNETAVRNTSTTDFVEIHTDFFAELTTRINNSKILVQGTLHFSMSDTGLRMGTVMYRSIGGAAYAVTDFRGDTNASNARAIFGSVTGGNLDQVLNVGFSFVDSPAQTAGTVLRYKPYWYCESPTYYVYLNRNARSESGFSHSRCASNVTLIEIAS